jgi:hypothetical protein
MPGVDRLFRSELIFPGAPQSTSCLKGLVSFYVLLFAWLLLLDWLSMSGELSGKLNSFRQWTGLHHSDG